MRIVFNFSHTGMANNGGTRTLVRCAEELETLGHDVIMFCGNNRYTWHKTQLKTSWPHHPQCDVSIATGYGSWKSVERQHPCVRAYYVRGLELWSAREHELLASFRAVDRVFVNSQWLLDYMKSKKIKATLQYPGLDWEWFKELGAKRDGVGALRNNRHKTKREEDIDGLEKRLGIPIWQLNRHIKRPDSTELNKWYNNLKVWFAPTELEGLHNPPMEAALAGCALVCTDHPKSGMQDYAIHGKTALVYPARQLDKAAAAVRFLLDNEDMRTRLNVELVELLRDKMGTRHDRMTEFASRLASE